MTAELSILPLASHHDRQGFSCGVRVLDDYLRKQASQDIRRRVARVYVAASGDEERIAGFFTLGAASFGRDALPDDQARRLPAYPVPAALIGRLAVDQGFRGRGVGGLLLLTALRLAVRANDLMAVHAIMVDAKDDAAVGFYRRYGFISFPSMPNRLFIPVETVVRAGL